MNALTRYQYGRALTRFTEFQRHHPGLDVPDQIRLYLPSLSPCSAHMAYCALRATFGPQIPWETIPRQPVRRNEARLQAGLFSEVVREQIRDCVQSAREWAAIELLWTLRRAEVARAQWADVDLSQHLIYVTRKGGKRGWTLLAGQAETALAEWFQASHEPPDEAYLFPGQVGGHVSPNTVNRWVRAILKRAGFYSNGRSAHAFRRTFATEYLREHPGDLRGLQKLLGHENIATTALYAFLQPADLQPRVAQVRL